MTSRISVAVGRCVPSGLSIAVALAFLAGCDDLTGPENSIVEYRTDRFGYLAEDEILLSLTNTTRKTISYDDSGCVVSIQRRINRGWSGSGPTLSGICVLVLPHPLDDTLAPGETFTLVLSVSELPFDGSGEYRFRTEVAHPDKGRRPVFTHGFIVAMEGG